MRPEFQSLPIERYGMGSGDAVVQDAVVHVE